MCFQNTKTRVFLYKNISGSKNNKQQIEKY